MSYTVKLFLLLILCLNCILTFGKTKDSTENYLVVFRVGVNKPHNYNLPFLQNGISVFLADKEFYTGVNVFNNYSRKKYQWEGIGDYIYIRNNYIINPHFGYVSDNSKKINYSIQLNFQFARYRNVVESSSNEIKNLLLNNLYNRNRITIQSDLFYTLYKKNKIFISLSTISLKKFDFSLFIGTGIQFKLFQF